MAVDRPGMSMLVDNIVGAWYCGCLENYKFTTIIPEVRHIHQFGSHWSQLLSLLTSGILSQSLNLNKTQQSWLWIIMLSLVIQYLNIEEFGKLGKLESSENVSWATGLKGLLGTTCPLIWYTQIHFHVHFFFGCLACLQRPVNKFQQCNTFWSYYVKRVEYFSLKAFSNWQKYGCIWMKFIQFMALGSWCQTLDTDTLILYTEGIILC